MECVCLACSKQWSSRSDELPRFCPSCSSRRVEQAAVSIAVKPAVIDIAVTNSSAVNITASQDAVIETPTVKPFKPRANKPIKKAWEQTKEEYIEEMKRFHKQLEFAKSIGFDASKVPVDMDCYHGNLLNTCQSFNCEVDSGRVAQMTRAMAK